VGRSRLADSRTAPLVSMRPGRPVRCAWRLATSTLVRPSTLNNDGVEEEADRIWLISFMHYDLGFFDHQSGRVECAPNPFDAKRCYQCPILRSSRRRSERATPETAL